MCPITNIASLSDLSRVVAAWEKEFFEPGLGYPTIWYRGQGRDVDPQPGILRPSFLHSCDQSDLQFGTIATQLWIREHTINRQYRRMTASLIPSDADPVFRYLFAQHHGFLTRLLDWTTNPLAALFFAASDSPSKDGVLFVINAQKLDQDGNLGKLAEMRDPDIKATVAAVFGDRKIKIKAQIIPLLPDLFAGRTLQQSSCFTLHTPPIGLNSGLVEQISPLVIPVLEKYVIPRRSKPKLLLMLRRLGVTDATLFHDLDNVAKELRKAWKI